MARGGQRENSGRKLKYDEPTDTIAFRFPISFIEDLKKRYAEDERNENVFNDLQNLYAARDKRAAKKSKA